ncbi:uncharacterized protein [Clytia hemisphaerica]|uniref:Fibrinogen C-terminal domain-containing protein n=1 Tax=Clytia hemisphaerica TaxID=252671 RepID=A0A7M5UVU0_9CNID
MLAFIIFVLRATFVYSQWYQKDLKDVISFTNDSTNGLSESIPVRSSIECVLKCKVKYMTSYYVETNKKCFCLKNEEQEIYSPNEENLNGELLKEHESYDCESKKTDSLEPMLSCKEVKEKCPDCSSGFYDIKFDNFTPIKAFCDLETDGGNWLKIVNINVSMANEWSTIMDNPYSLDQLKEIESKQFLLNPNDVLDLFKTKGYTEMRVKCYKDYHQRTLHVVMSGDRLINFIAHDTKSSGLCGNLRFLEDSSATSSYNCNNLSIGYHGHTNPPYYSNLIMSAGPHINFEKGSGRYECDDNTWLHITKQVAGTWEFYIR